MLKRERIISRMLMHITVGSQKLDTALSRYFNKIFGELSGMDAHA